MSNHDRAIAQELFDVTHEYASLEYAHLVRRLGATTLAALEEEISVGTQALRALSADELQKYWAGALDTEPERPDAAVRISEVAKELSQQADFLFGTVHGYGLGVVEPDYLDLSTLKAGASSYDHMELTARLGRRGELVVAKHRHLDLRRRKLTTEPFDLEIMTTAIRRLAEVNRYLKQDTQP